MIKSLKKRKIFVSAPMEFLPMLKEQISKVFEVTFAYGAEKEDVEGLLRSNRFEAWLVSPCPKYVIDVEMLSLCPTLKIIATPSTGSNHIMTAEVKKTLGLKIFTLKGTSVVENIFASSEFTFNLLISVIRKTPYAFESVKKGEWRETEYKFRGRELNGLTLGIIGFGRIGSNLAKYSLAFGMKIVAYDPYVKIKDDKVYQVKKIDDLVSKVDAIAICVHLNEETYKMINNTLFSKMKDGVYFINTSRGDVIDEKALVKNLENGKILAAGLDVISDEFTSLKDEHPLIKYAKKNNNLIITPHIAGLTYDSEEKAQTAAYIAIKNFLTNK